MVVIQAKAQIIDNDSQVVNVMIKKETGKENKIVDPSEYVYNGVAAQYTMQKLELFIIYKTQSLSLLLYQIVESCLLCKVLFHSKLYKFVQFLFIFE